jgi:hypothetical protein
MLRKIIKNTEKYIHPAAVGTLLTVTALFSLLYGCSGHSDVYHVRYDGRGHTQGDLPVDSRVYYSGSKAAVLDGSHLAKGALKFLGWSWTGSETLLQGGDKIVVYDDVWLFAEWGNDPAAFPYKYIDDPSGRGVIITGYFPYNFESAVKIPNKLPNTTAGKTVIGIGEAAFAGINLESLTLPGGLEFIGNKAFSGNRLKQVKIPDSVKNIGTLAFQNSGLTDLTLGSGLESIGDYAFDGNTLAALFLPPRRVSIGEGAFADNPLKTIEIGNNVAISNDTALGTYGAGFRKHYIDEDARAGFYVYKNDTWTGPLKEGP